MVKNVLNEAERCLQCKNPKCKAACPVSTSVNEMVKLLLEGKIEDAGKMLFENNPLSVVCSLVCPHEIQCEGNCVLNAKNQPINVSSIENYISDYYLNLIDEKPVKDHNKKVAIIGSGPAGITIAIILAKKGYDITIFEAHDKIGGVMQYGIPDFRLPKTVIEKLRVKLLQMGIKIRPNFYIGPVITIDHLFRDGYKAIFIGTGVWKPNGLNIKGESLGHVHYGIDYLKNPDSYELGDRVCVIGAGNVAMDVARTAKRKGIKEVYVTYRKGEEEMTALRHEIMYAKLDGVKFLHYKTPVEFVDDGVILRNTKVTVNEETGKEVFEEVEGSDELFRADSVILAIGQGPRNNITSSTTGIEIKNTGLVITDEVGHTTRDGVFASGDVVTGAKTVVEAVRVSKLVAESIDKYVTELESK